MTSGVYKLTFSSGLIYIGKSNNIETRWKQHLDKLNKGTAASIMQAEFNRYGPFIGEILHTCHSDHADIIEAMLINRLKPQLNSTYPDDPFIGLDTNEVIKILDLLNMSTIQLVNKIYEFNEGQNVNNANIAELEDRVLELSEKRTKETIKLDLDNLLEEKDCEINALGSVIALLKNNLKDANTLLAYHKLPWYKKLFK